ncbi:MAG TPA: radical SAM protein [Gemmatimonadaceae bacterium]|nr:radical SAM protein [Gemmatimonadaceae bacterium]
MDEMTLERKIEILMTMAGDDRESGSAMSLPPRLRHANDVGALRPLNFRTVSAGRGRKTTLLRILMTNACSFNCYYCPMRRDRNMPRALLKPHELVKIFLEARRRGWCEGLFITTGIPGRPVKVMDDLIAVLELLRHKHKFDGYIHVKILPGAEPAQIERITALATRVSLNLEAPCGDTLTAIAPEKSYATAIDTLSRARKLVVLEQAHERDGRRRNPLRPGGASGMTTQFVVGATPDSDRAIVNRVSELYNAGGVHHVHFSAFRPIRETPLESRPAVPALREHRLYQTDYLLRYYGFNESEVVFEADGNLPLANDPKVAWALAHPERFPLELTTATYEALVRVPGIGVVTARRIVDERRNTVIRGLADLKRIGVQTNRAAGFLALRGRALEATRWTEQLGFWNPADQVGVRAQVYDVSPGTFR